MPLTFPFLLMRLGHGSMTNLEAVIDEKVMLTAAQQRNLFVDLCYSGLDAATASLDVAAVFPCVGYIDPKKAKLRIPYQFVPPEIQHLLHLQSLSPNPSRQHGSCP